MVETPSVQVIKLVSHDTVSRSISFSEVSVYELTVCSRAVNHANAKEMVEEKCKPQLDRWRNCFDPATKASDQVNSPACLR